MLNAENLIKEYTLGGQTIRALNDVSVEIKEGDMLAIVGASGSGKSTLMNILGCLDRPDSGHYKIDGEDVAYLSNNKLADIRNRRIGFVFQSFNLLPRMSAIENVELPMLYGARGDARDRAVAALKTVGLDGRMHHEPNQLSGGQRQRVAVARAIAGDPAIILADEPTGNLDSRTGAEILKLFQAINEQGHTVVIVTHDPHVAEHCKREIRMKDGVVADRRN